jgi:hypothetical protein
LPGQAVAEKSPAMGVGLPAGCGSDQQALARSQKGLPPTVEPADGRQTENGVRHRQQATDETSCRADGCCVEQPTRGGGVQPSPVASSQPSMVWGWSGILDPGQGRGISCRHATPPIQQRHPAKLARRMKRRWRIVLMRTKGELLGTWMPRMRRPQRQLRRSNSGSMDGSGGGCWSGSSANPCQDAQTNRR